MHIGTCTKSSLLPGSSLGAQRLQTFKTSSLQSTPIIQGFRATLRSYYFRPELKIFSAINPKENYAMALVTIKIKANEFEDSLLNVKPF